MVTRYTEDSFGFFSFIQFIENDFYLKNKFCLEFTDKIFYYFAVFKQKENISFNSRLFRHN